MLKKIALGLVLSLLSIIVLLFARNCYIAVGAEPFGCLPLIIPSLPVSLIIDGYGMGQNWWLIISLSAIWWFMIGVLIQLGVSKIFKKK